MSSDEAPAKRIRRNMDNELPTGPGTGSDSNDHVRLGDMLIHMNELTGQAAPPLSAREEAHTLDAFMLEPHRYRPQDIFLTNAFHVEDETVLTHAVKTLNLVAVATLLEAGADANQANKKGVTPISAAAHKGNTDVMRCLIRAHANVNALNTSGSTALIQASHFGHVDAVKLLLDSNASADFANHKGTTALMRASQEGHLLISSLLVDARADVNRKNNEGMNALMLASQRGHAEMVHLLITKGAVMDEQTAQGSTALMLACKRGHGKCVEVLVSMGAEIYMRDTRNRTARDTATRRSHLDLLEVLESQVQVRRVQEYRRAQRTEMLMKLRAAAHRGHVRVTTADSRALLLTRAVKIGLCEPEPAAASSSSSSSSSGAGGGRDRRKWRQPMLTAAEASEVVARPENQQAVDVITEMLTRPHGAAAAAAPPAWRGAATLAPRPPGYAEWQWPMLLLRCMDLPPGLFELIAEMLPLPRVWAWSLGRLRRRCKLAPHQALLDSSVIIDDILTDASIFAGRDQRAQLVRLSRNPHLMPAVSELWNIPEPLLQSLAQWSDTQSLVLRASEAEVTFRAPLARQMLEAAVALHRWYRHRVSTARALGLRSSSASSSSSAAGGAAAAAAALLLDAADEDGMEATDAGAEEESQSDASGLGDEDDDDEVMDQDTETEMMHHVAGGPGEDDSDGDDGPPAALGHHHVHHTQHGHNYGVVLGLTGFGGHH